MHPRARVVVVGGGYAGVHAANLLARHTDVVVVNPRPTFVERTRLHQLAADTGGATHDLATLLAPGVRLVVDRVTRIDAPGRHVVLDAGTAIAYDHCVLAVGSTAAPSVPPAAYRVDDLESALRLRRGLAVAARDATVAVAGGGLTGIELAAELAQAGRRVVLACGGVLGPSLAAPARRSVARRLAHLGVDVRATAAITEVRADAAHLDDGTVVPSALTVWAAGFGVPDLARHSGLATDVSGRLCTDATLTAVDDERVVAAGDAAAVGGAALRMSCQAALPTGRHAARTVLARLAGAEARALDLRFTGSCVALGRGAATVQFARRDDTPVAAYLGGWAGAGVKEALLRGTVRTLRRSARG